MNGIDLTIIDNTITNIDEIITYLTNAQVDYNLSEHLKTLKNSLSSKDITNKQELESIINTKIMEYEMSLNTTKDNLTTLRMLQETNEEFKSIGIIQTTPDKNDSNRYIDYITYQNPDGTLEVLCCDSENFINDFIESHKNVIQNYSSQEIFHHFKEYIHRELKFASKEEYDQDDNLHQESTVREEQVEEVEYELMEEYRRKYSIQSKIEMTVDQFGERLYRLGDGLFTFKTVEGNRVMETLKTPTLNKNSVDDLLSELDSIEETPVIVPTTEIKEENHAPADTNYAAVENLLEDQFDEEQFKEITAKRDIYEVELSAYDEHIINVSVKYLLTKMQKDIDNSVPFNHDTELIHDYLESPRGEKASIIATYEDIKSGIAKENELSDLEKEFAQIYLNKKEQMKSLGLNQTNDKKLELNLPVNNESGLSTIVMLLEIIILAMFVIMILRLDI